MSDAPIAPEDGSQAPITPTTGKPFPVWALLTVTGVAGLVIGLAIGGIGLGAVQAAQQAEADEKAAQAAADASEKLNSILPSAVKACGADKQYAVVSDGGMTLTVDHKGKDDFAGLAAKEMWCIVDSLKAPTAVKSHMEQTTSMDGRQSASWGNIEVSWSYHPKRGMDSVYTVVE